MHKELISILVPFKNTSLFLTECLESIFNQTYSNWELIIVDDNSTDNSLSIVRSYAENDSRIKLFKNKGSGIIDALQLAYSKSEGALITRMDSDDIMMENKFIAPSVNIEELDPLANGLPIVTKRIDNIEVKTAISNSFGFGGTNASLVFSTKNL